MENSYVVCTTHYLSASLEGQPFQYQDKGVFKSTARGE